MFRSGTAGVGGRTRPPPQLPLSGPGGRQSATLPVGRPLTNPGDNPAERARPWPAAGGGGLSHAKRGLDPTL
jgi:hypothetical protein